MPRVTLISAVRDLLTAWQEGDADELAPAMRALAVAYEQNRQYQNERRMRSYRRQREGFRPMVDGIDYDSSEQ